MRMQFISRYFIPFIFLFIHSAAAATFDLQETREALDIMPEARIFHAQIDGIHIVGVEMGPKNGQPAILLGGYTSNFPYLRKFARELVSRGYRIFIYNPPGQGEGPLYSGHDTQTSDLGSDGMIKVLTAFRNYVYQTAGEQKVLLLGHSLAGMIVRAASLGISIDQNGVAKFSQGALAQARRETALIVPMFSLPLFGDDIWADASKLKVFLVKTLTPFVSQCMSLINCKWTWPINEFLSSISSSQLIALQNSALKGLFGAPDLDEAEVRELGFYLWPQQISSQILQDLGRWVETKAFTTVSGLNMGELWSQIQSGSQAIPTLYVGGLQDTLLDVKPFFNEAHSIRRSRVITAPAGHIGAFLSETQPHEMARLIAHSHTMISQQGCAQWLRADELRDEVIQISHVLKNNAK